MPALIHLYQSFNEAAHAIQELEAVKIPVDDISLIILNGKPTDTALRAKFFATMGVHELEGLDAVCGAGWIVTDSKEKSLTACLIENGLSGDYASTYLEGVKRGAVLLGARVTDKQQEMARQIMCEDHCPLDPRMRGRHFAAKAGVARDESKISADRSSAMLIGNLGKAKS